MFFLCESQTVSDPLEHSGLCTSGDSVPKSATLELAEHSASIGPQSWGDGLLSKMDTASHPQPAGLPGVAPESQRVEDPLWKDQQGTTGSRLETGEAIVAFMRKANISTNLNPFIYHHRTSAQIEWI